MTQVRYPQAQRSAPSHHELSRSSRCLRDGLVGVPLVADGVVYQSGPIGLVFANDLKTGKLLWTFDAGIQFPLGIIPAWSARLSRGLALWQDKVIRATHGEPTKGMLIAWDPGRAGLSPNPSIFA